MMESEEFVEEAPRLRSGSSPPQVRPASPIIDIYGDEEDNHDTGGTINVDLQSPPSSPINTRHEGFFGEENKITESGVWNWFQYAKEHIDAGIVSANHYLEDSAALQATTNTVYSIGEETHKKLAQAGTYTSNIGHNVMSSVQSYGQVLLDLTHKKEKDPIRLNILSDKHIDTSVVTSSFHELFYITSSATYDVVSGLAAQIVGPAAAIEGCKLRIQAARAQNVVADNAVVVAVESFINEIIPGTWVEQYCMLVSDLPNEVEIHVFSQPVNLPTSLAEKSKEATPAQYALRSSGFAKSIVEVISETFPDVNIKDWYFPFVGITNASILHLNAKLLSALYRQRIVNCRSTRHHQDEGEDEIDLDAMERS